MAQQVIIGIFVLLAIAYYSYWYRQIRVRKDIDVPAAAVRRTDLLYGYYGTMDDQVAKTLGQINLLWECQFQGMDKAIANILEARLPTVLDLAPQTMFRARQSGRCFDFNPDAENNLRYLFTRLREAGALHYVHYLYPMDEPNTNVSSAADLQKAIDATRKVAAEFPELDGYKLSVIYAAKPETYDCIGAFDVVGVDDYDEKSQIFINGTYANLMYKKRPDATVMLLPGGAFGQDPTPFENWAHTHPEVSMIIPFVWFGGREAADKWVGIGDDKNPLKQRYEIFGKSISAK